MNHSRPPLGEGMPLPRGFLMCILQFLTLARAQGGGGVDATPMSFSGMAVEPLGGSRQNFAELMGHHHSSRKCDEKSVHFIHHCSFESPSSKEEIARFRDVVSL